MSMSHWGVTEASLCFCSQGNDERKLKSFRDALKITVTTAIMIHFRRNLIAQQSFRKPH